MSCEAWKDHSLHCTTADVTAGAGNGMGAQRQPRVCVVCVCGWVWVVGGGLRLEAGVERGWRGVAAPASLSRARSSISTWYSTVMLTCITWYSQPAQRTAELPTAPPACSAAAPPTVTADAAEATAVVATETAAAAPSMLAFHSHALPRATDCAAAPPTCTAPALAPALADA
eukprot:scaffold71848_cov63-Phaeocystis_antarctica.AAC.1